MPEPAGHRLLPEFRARSPLTSSVLWLLILGAMVLWLIGLLPAAAPDQETMVLAGSVGLITVWRWSWGGLHFLRMLLYTRRVFPRLRAAAERTTLPPGLYIVVTSYRMATAVNAAVYGRLLDEIAAMQVPAHVMACITDPADAWVLRALFSCRPGLPEGTELHLLPQAGTGKRAAMVEALGLIAAMHPPSHAQVVLMDGDTLLGEGTLAATCRLLASQADVGAVTTDNLPLVCGGTVAREWYRLRMAQRHVLMCSMSLSRRLLVLTGRFSVFRAPLATSADFLRSVERDSIEHWRLGTIGMLTGDDKSTWFTVLRHGWNMLYVPDATVYCIEELPGRGFFRSTVALMRRWYGNMARNNYRARHLGRRRLGIFVWLSLLDQRVSSWTALSGPTIALYVAATRDASFLLLYGLWVALSRGLLCLLTWMASGRLHPLFPLLLYYNQIAGALVKIHVQHHPDRQRWTRQRLGTEAPHRTAAFSPWFLLLEAGAFLLLLAVLHGALSPALRPEAATGLATLLDSTNGREHAPRADCGARPGVPCTSVRVPRLPTVQTRQTPPPDP